MIDRLRAIKERFDELERLMADPEVVSDLALLQKYAREHANRGAGISGIQIRGRPRKSVETPPIYGYRTAVFFYGDA